MYFALYKLPAYIMAWQFKSVIDKKKKIAPGSWTWFARSDPIAEFFCSFFCSEKIAVTQSSPRLRVVPDVPGCRGWSQHGRAVVRRGTPEEEPAPPPHRQVGVFGENKWCFFEEKSFFQKKSDVFLKKNYVCLKKWCFSKKVTFFSEKKNDVFLKK